jgi:hypothetical protein
MTPYIFPDVPARGRARYQVAFFDNRGVLFQIHDLIGAEQLRYSRSLNTYGQFMMTLPADQADPRMMQKDALAWVLRTDPLTLQQTPEQVYLLRYADTVPGEMGDAFVIEGYTPEHLLSRLIYDPNNDPDVANGYSTKGKTCATLMHEIVTEQVIAPLTGRPVYPGISTHAFVSDASPYVAFRKEVSEEYLLDLLADLAATYQTDFWLAFTGIDTRNGHPLFEFTTGRVGHDHSKLAFPDGPYVYLTPSAGHLISPQLTLDAREEKTAVLVLGQGANGHRLIYRKHADTISDSPYNWIETVAQANQSDDLDAYTTAADTALDEGKAQVTFTFEPVETAGARYREDWDVGDVLTVGHRGTELTMRVTDIELSAQASGEVIKVTAELYAPMTFEPVTPSTPAPVVLQSGGTGQKKPWWRQYLTDEEFDRLWGMAKAHPELKKKLKKIVARLVQSRAEVAGATEEKEALPAAGEGGRMASATAADGSTVFTYDSGSEWRTSGVVQATHPVEVPSTIWTTNTDWAKEDDSFQVMLTPVTSRAIVTANVLAQRAAAAGSNGYLDIGYFETSGTLVRAGHTPYGLAQTVPGVLLQYRLEALFTDLTPGQSYTFYLVGKSGATAGNVYPAQGAELWVKGD